MAKVYFNYGTMGSAKSAQLIMNAYQYNDKGLNVLAMTPHSGCRDKCYNGIHICKYGKTKHDVIYTNIESRVGIKLKAYAIDSVNSIRTLKNITLPDVVFIDEVQFCSVEMIEELFVIACMYDIPVHCYGLMTDSSTSLFEGSKRLIELGATLNHIKSIGTLGETPIINAKIVNGVATITNPMDNNIQVGREETYKAITLKEYFKIKNVYPKDDRGCGYLGFNRNKDDTARMKEIIAEK